LTTREAWDAVGGFDEAFFPGYFEDVDLCLSLRAAGYRVVYAPRARLRHLGGASTAPGQRSVAGIRNGRRFIAKWHDTLAEYDPQPRPRGRLTAVDIAVVRAARRPPPARRPVGSESPMIGTLTELEAFRIHARVLDAALALDDQLVLELARDRARPGWPRRAAVLMQLGRQILGRASHRS